MVEPAIATAIAAGHVPSSITADYLMQNRNHPAIVAIIVIGLLTFVVVVLRCGSRLFFVRKFGIDDGLAAASLVCSWIDSPGASIDQMRVTTHQSPDAPTCFYSTLDQEYQPREWETYRVHRVCYK